MHKYLYQRNLKKKLNLGSANDTLASNNVSIINGKEKEEFLRKGLNDKAMRYMQRV